MDLAGAPDQDAPARAPGWLPGGHGPPGGRALPWDEPPEGGWRRQAVVSTILSTGVGLAPRASGTSVPS